MRIIHLVSRSSAAALLLSACGLVFSAGAQQSAPTGDAPRQELPPKPTLVVPGQSGPQPVTGRSNLYCGGFIQYAPAPNDMQIVGGEEEQEQRNYSVGDYVYVNVGAVDGVREGQEYTVVRPRGQFKTKLSKKKGWLGVYTQELGSLRVTEVKERVSVAVITQACEQMMLGDLLRGMSQRVAPLERPAEKLDRFADPSGKQRGRIVLARDTREALTRDQVVFIDLGSEDNVRPGDLLTIYRPLGKGNISRHRDDEVTRAASSGFESDVFQGGKFSNQSPRVRDANQTGVYGPVETHRDVKGKRPPMPRKIVGEMVILSVQQRTATAVITQVAQEVHTGDHVEVK